jgi:CubicO group peptidase (beta-lactamase class C family)
MKNHHRKITALFLAVMFILSSGAFAVSVSSAPVNPNYLPLRMIFEARGADVYWCDVNRRIEVTHADDEYIFFMGSANAYKNGSAFALAYPIAGDGTSFIAFEDAWFLFEHESGEYAGAIATAVLTAFTFLDMFAVPGYTVAIVDAETGFTWTGGFGHACTQTRVFVNETTVFSLASISKMFTAVAVMQLVEEGLIDLDEPVVTYLPEFSLLPNPMYGGDSDEITIRMLLSHTSGIHGDFFGHGALTFGGHHPGYLNGLLEKLAGEYMNFPQDMIFAYANHGFNVLGILIARLAGYSDYFAGFDAYMTENIFAPAGMEMSAFIVCERTIAAMAKPYVMAGRPDAYLHYNGLPTGGLHSNAADMARFMHVLLGGGDLLSPESAAVMLARHDFEFGLSPMGMAYGLGTMHRLELDGYAHAGHGGNLIQFHSEMVFDLDSGIGVFTSTNSLTGALGVSSLATAILQAAVMEKTGAIDRLDPVADPGAVPVELTSEELRKLTGIYNFVGDGMSELVYTEGFGLHIDGVPLPFVPMSDGSFDLNGTRFWFIPIVEDGAEAIIVTVGPFASHVYGARLDASSFFEADEEITSWFGTYAAPMDPETGQVSIVGQILLRENAHGFAELLIFPINSLTGMGVAAPLTYIDGIWFLGVSPLEFLMEGDTAVIYLSGVRFVRIG